MSDLVGKPAEPPREGRLFCSLEGCGKGYSAWIQCPRTDCPKIHQLAERGA